MAASTRTLTGTAAQVRRARERGDVEAWSQQRLVREICATCQVSPLAAYRLACGWTLSAATQRLAELRRPEGERRSAISVQMLNAWERGRVRPLWASIELLCALYRVSPDQLGFGRRYRDDGDADRSGGEPAIADLADSALERNLRRAPASALVPDSTVSALEVVRQRIDDYVLGAETATGQLDVFESSVERHGLRYTALPDLLPTLAADAAGVKVLMASGLTSGQRRRAYQVLSRIATLIGPGLWLSGHRTEGLFWMDTALGVAELAEDRTLESWVLGLHAKLILYDAKPAHALRLAERAVAVPGAGAASTLWAWDIHAQTLARLGQSRQALAVLNRLTTAYDRWQPRLPAGLWGFPEQQLHKTIGAVHAFAGETFESAAAIATAQRMYPSGYFQAFLAFDQTISLIRDGEVEHACTVAATTWTALPPDQRDGIFRTKLRLSLTRIPPRYQGLACVNDLWALIGGR